MNTPSITPTNEEFVQPLRKSNGAANHRLSFDRDAESQLTQYLAIIRRRKWIVAAIILAAILAAIAYTMTATELYRATSTLQIEREAAKVVDLEDLEPNPTVSGAEFYQTQYGLLQSRSVALEAARRLRLADNAPFLTGYTQDEDDSQMQQSRQQRLETAVKLIQDNTLVTPVRNSGLVELSFEAPDPRIAAQVANALSEAYITLNLQRRYDASGYARNFLEEELAKARAELEDAEQQIVTYAGNQQLIEINRETDQAGNTSGQSLAEIDLEVLNRALAESRADRIDAQARLNAAPAGNRTNEALSDSTLAQLRTQIAQLEGQYRRDLATFKPEYPAMRALRNQIDQLQSALNARSSDIGASTSSVLRAAYQAAAQREQALQAQVNELKNAVLDQGQRRIQYDILSRDADRNRALYDTLLERYKQIGVTAGIGVNNVSIVDQARPPSSPYTPNLLANLLLALVGGTIVGLLAAFILDQLDDGIKSPADIEKILDMPLLGVVPKVRSERPVEDITDRASPLSEAYLAIQTSLNFSTSEGVPRALAVTSSNPSEGKSTTAFSIAATLARLGHSALLVDGDMRNPSVHKILKVDNRHGLVEVLTGNANMNDVLRSTQFDQLSVITSGPIPPNPAELLSGRSLMDFLALAQSRFDHVIVDCPPTLGLSDAPLLSSAIGNTVFVLAANATSAKSAIGSLRRLEEANAHVLGAVLTKFEAAEHGYSYNYTYQYGSKRGQELT